MNKQELLEKSFNLVYTELSALPFFLLNKYGELSTTEIYEIAKNDLGDNWINLPKNPSKFSKYLLKDKNMEFVIPKKIKTKFGFKYMFELTDEGKKLGNFAGNLLYTSNEYGISFISLSPAGKSILYKAYEVLEQIVEQDAKSKIAILNSTNLHKNSITNILTKLDKNNLIIFNSYNSVAEGKQKLVVNNKLNFSESGYEKELLSLNDRIFTNEDIYQTLKANYSSRQFEFIIKHLKQNEYIVALNGLKFNEKTNIELELKGWETFYFFFKEAKNYLLGKKSDLPTYQVKESELENIFYRFGLEKKTAMSIEKQDQEFKEVMKNYPALTIKRKQIEGMIGRKPDRLIQTLLEKGNLQKTERIGSYFITNCDSFLK